LHEIVNDHIDFGYKEAKYLLAYAQEDPNNSANVLAFYTNVSTASGSYGTGGNYLNREHVWANSHGTLENVRNLNGDIHNLHAADASVNVVRSNYDFDNVVDGTYIEEADAYYGGGAFMPADREKGQVARTLMYMAVRYEGTNGELDLVLADRLGTAPSAEHGKLTTLLEWNNAFPPTEFERRRNDRIEQSQGNRNPFVDNPEWANLIWAEASLSAVSIGNVSISPLFANTTDNVVFNAELLTILGALPSATLYYGASRDADTYNTSMTGQSTVSATMDLSSFSGGDQVFYKVKTDSGDSICGSFYLDTRDQLISISAVQGTGAASSLTGQKVAIAGVVTSNLDNVFTLQSGSGARSGVVVYSYFRGHIGDSVKVVGDVAEYNGLTEMSNVTSVYSYGASTAEIIPDTIGINDINEDYEGVLIMLKGVSFNEGGNDFASSNTYPYPTYTVSDGVNDMVFYTRYGSRLNDMPIPNGTINIKAVVSEYNGNYQIMSNDTSWFTPTTDNTPPQILNVETEDRTDSYAWVYVNFNEIIDETDAKEEDNFVFSDGIIVKRNYYDENKPNQAKIIVENISIKDYTLTVSNVKDAFGNVMDKTVFNFTSTVDKATAISEQEAAKFVSLYPIPVSAGIMTVETKESMQSLSVYAISGQILMSEININQSQKELNLSGLESGNYLLQVQLKDKVVTRKFTIQ
jgi:endonuclease I